VEQKRLSTESLLIKMGQTPQDQRLWEEFVERYAPLFYKWARNYGLQQSDAEDVTQEILQKVHRSLANYRRLETSKARAWLSTIARHESLDWCKRLNARRSAGITNQAEVLDLIAARDDLIDRLDYESELEVLAEAHAQVKKRVKPTTWESYYLMKVVGQSAKEAAATLGLSPDAVQKNSVRVLLEVSRTIVELEKE
jgi:RNA polymerase sigma factor (sigma-70 family)